MLTTAPNIFITRGSVIKYSDNNSPFVLKRMGLLIFILNIK